VAVRRPTPFQATVVLLRRVERSTCQYSKRTRHGYPLLSGKRPLSPLGTCCFHQRQAPYVKLWLTFVILKVPHCRRSVSVPFGLL
jgi:hypothetical protein